MAKWQYMNPYLAAALVYDGALISLSVNQVVTTLPLDTGRKLNVQSLFIDYLLIYYNLFNVDLSVIK